MTVFYFQCKCFFLLWIIIFAINWTRNLKVMTPFDRSCSKTYVQKLILWKLLAYVLRYLRFLFFDFNNGCHENMTFSQNAQWCQLGMTRIIDMEGPGMHNMQKSIVGTLVQGWTQHPCLAARLHVTLRKCLRGIWNCQDSVLAGRRVTVLLRLYELCSRRLSNVKCRCPQTKKWSFRTWVRDKFHQFTCFRCFELLTDHKPLEAIFSQKVPHRPPTRITVLI